MKVILNKQYKLVDVKNILDDNEIYFEYEPDRNTLVIDDIDYVDFIKVIDKKYFDRIIPIFDLKYALRFNKLSDTIIKVGDVSIGGDKPIIIAGPCAVEDEEAMRQMAKEAKANHADLFRAGAFKPRTNPYSYQGKNIEGLHILKKISNELHIPVVSEITDLRYLNEFVDSDDVIQIGARNMQNFALLEELGKIDKPVLLKRGFSNSIEELLCAAEYIMKNGNHNVILCERGIRTPLSYTRNTLDLSTVVVLKQLTHLPVLVDPSHASGRRKLIIPLAKAALAAGADGLIIETHTNPNYSISDSEQAISFNDLKKL